MVGLVGLQKGPPRQLLAAAAPHHLGDEAEGALVAAEIIRVQHLVGGQHPHQGDPGEIQPLGDHLGADEDIVLPPAKGGKQPLMAVLAHGGILVHPQDAGFGKTQPQRLLHLLRAHPGIPHHPQWGQAFGGSVL